MTDYEILGIDANADEKTMLELSKLAIDKEINFFDKWKKADFEKVKVAKVFKMNWEKKNMELIQLLLQLLLLQLQVLVLKNHQQLLLI